MAILSRKWPHTLASSGCGEAILTPSPPPRQHFCRVMQHSPSPDMDGVLDHDLHTVRQESFVLFGKIISNCNAEREKNSSVQELVISWLKSSDLIGTLDVSSLTFLLEDRHKQEAHSPVASPKYMTGGAFETPFFRIAFSPVGALELLQEITQRTTRPLI